MATYDLALANLVTFMRLEPDAAARVLDVLRYNPSVLRTLVASMPQDVPGVAVTSNSTAASRLPQLGRVAAVSLRLPLHCENATMPRLPPDDPRWERYDRAVDVFLSTLPGLDDRARDAVLDALAAAPESVLTLGREAAALRSCAGSTQGG